MRERARFSVADQTLVQIRASFKRWTIRLFTDVMRCAPPFKSTTDYQDGSREGYLMWQPPITMIDNQNLVSVRHYFYNRITNGTSEGSKQQLYLQTLTCRPPSVLYAYSKADPSNIRRINTFNMTCRRVILTPLNSIFRIMYQLYIMGRKPQG